MHEQRLCSPDFSNNHKYAIMKTLANIFFDAIQADEELMTAIGGRLTSTCFEIPPGETDDNTPLPNIIVTDEGFNSNGSTKDYVWEGDEDVVMASVDVAATEDGEVSELVKMVRRAISNYICAMYENDENAPQLQSGFPQSAGIAWDWMKPCYYQKITYQCTVSNTEDDEQEE